MMGTSSKIEFESDLKSIMKQGLWSFNIDWFEQIADADVYKKLDGDLTNVPREAR